MKIVRKVVSADDPVVPKSGIHQLCAVNQSHRDNWYNSLAIFLLKVKGKMKSQQLWEKKVAT